MSKYALDIDSLTAWLEEQIEDSERQQAIFDRRAKETDYDDYDNEISRHEETGFRSALNYVLRKVIEETK
jgi:hypothetical protein